MKAAIRLVVDDPAPFLIAAYAPTVGAFWWPTAVLHVAATFGQLAGAAILLTVLGNRIGPS